ncbi:MAG TPA: crotonase/enoyl-CoA hydratase family protein [Alphaproteobacteria bacterium]|nr:crotonase/enoyl-CoA hydratase family protein [Alphaproteobacteria bacterium]
MQQSQSVLVERDANVLIVSINRVHARNAVDEATAHALAEAFRSFDRDDQLSVAILTGAQGTFCAGADLREIAEGKRGPVDSAGSGPMGPTWLLLSKPVIAAIEGYAVAGGLELALWCDLRVAARDATFGVFNRRWGVPLIDLGTVRLPRMIGQSRALDLVLTGRAVGADEALSIGLINRVVEKGKALEAARELAHSLAVFPQGGLRGDRMSLHEQWSLPWDEACANELKHGLRAMASGEAVSGAGRFAKGAGRHGSFGKR